jgi:hypothetical protein
MELLNDYRDSTYSCYWAFWDDFQGEWFDSSFRRQSLVFMSPPLAADVDWIGIPRMKFLVRSDAEKYPVNVQVYEVDGEGAKHFVNRINYVGRGVVPGQMHAAEADGNAHAHTFRAGNRIRIEVTNLDMTNRKLLGWYPFVVPVFLRSTISIATGAEGESYVELPLRWSSAPDSLFIDTTDVIAGAPEGGAPLPRSLALAQNYPNPFNSSTVIRYDLPERGFAALRVYNLLGEEVASLAEGVLPPGVRHVRFEAGDLPGGIYICRLHSEGRSVSRKLLLLK